MEAGKLKLEYSAVSPKQFFDELYTIFKHKIDDKGLKFTIDISTGLPETLLLDKSRIRQILINLIGNAVKFTYTGEIKLTVDYNYPGNEKSNEIDFIFTVEDTGIGIPKEQIHSIFGAFSQLKGQKYSQYGGTGLGLAITMRLVEMMGGKITVHSEIDKGTIFEILIKDVEIASVNCTTVFKEKPFSCDSIKFEQGSILIVDDIDYNRELLKGFFENSDFALLEAENGKEAIEKAEKYQPDLILLDMKMPIMNGLQAAKVLKDSKKLKNIPIIFITASAMKKDEKIIKDTGHLYLKKPLFKADLFLEMMKILPYTQAKTDVVFHDFVQAESVGEESAKNNIIPPPDKEIKILYDLAMGGNLNAVLKHADYLEQLKNEYIPFAAKLKKLATNYQDEELLNFVEQYLEEMCGERMGSNLDYCI